MAHRIDEPLLCPPPRRHLVMHHRDVPTDNHHMQRRAPLDRQQQLLRAGDNEILPLDDSAISSAASTPRGCSPDGRHGSKACSTPLAGGACATLNGLGDLGGDVFGGRRMAFLVAARRLLALVDGHGEVESVQ